MWQVTLVFSLFRRPKLYPRHEVSACEARCAQRLLLSPACYYNACDTWKSRICTFGGWISFISPNHRRSGWTASAFCYIGTGQRKEAFNGKVIFGWHGLYHALWTRRATYGWYELSFKGGKVPIMWLEFSQRRFQRKRSRRLWGVAGALHGAFFSCGRTAWLGLCCADVHHQQSSPRTGSRWGHRRPTNHSIRNHA